MEFVASEYTECIKNVMKLMRVCLFYKRLRSEMVR